MTLALAACGPENKVLRLSGVTMGTTYNVVAIDKNHQVSDREAQAKIDTALKMVNQQMSNWDPNSEISRFNAQTSVESVPLSPELMALMHAAERVHVASDGRFDTTMGPLIELWGFGKDGAKQIPTDAQIADALARSGHADTLVVNEMSLQKKQPNTQVYLAAIAKGYGADQVGHALEELGIRDYMGEIGGDLYASGMNPNGQPWQIGIEKPAALSGGLIDVVGISNLGMASSGDYRNYFERDGERFSHIIDPVTGRPITHKTASTTVLAENGMLADAWATAMLTLGREKGLMIAEAQNLAVLFIERDTSSSELVFKPTASSRFTALTA
jgi:thiamine biosynthesis lipoprotein